MGLTFRAPNTSTSKTGMPIQADTKGLAALGRTLRRTAPDVWKAYRVSVRAAAIPVLRDAQARSMQPGSKPGSNPSSRVAASLRIQVMASGNVKIVGGGAAAPEAAAIENKGKGFVRHPVGGSRENWTAKNSRPAYLSPAGEARQAEVAAAVDAAVAAAVELGITRGM